MDDDWLLASRTPRRWWRLVTLVAVGAVLVATTSASWTRLRGDLRAVDTDLTATGSDLDTVRADLVDRYTRLAAVRADLSASRSTLRGRTHERDVAERRVIAAQSALEETKGLLGQRTSELGRRETNLALLNRCFVGASDALNQIAVADFSGFAETLRGIKDVCAAARAEP